jgi:hypothetical protein
MIELLPIIRVFLDAAHATGTKTERRYLLPLVVAVTGAFVVFWAQSRPAGYFTARFKNTHVWSALVSAMIIMEDTRLTEDIPFLLETVRCISPACRTGITAFVSQTIVNFRLCYQNR